MLLIKFFYILFIYNFIFFHQTTHIVHTNIYYTGLSSALLLNENKYQTDEGIRSSKTKNSAIGLILGKLVCSDSTLTQLNYLLNGVMTL